MTRSDRSADRRSAVFGLAHISDLHIGPLPPVTARELANKRCLGYLAWRLRKQRAHRTEVLEALRRDLQSEAPDHVVVTGDLVNLALEGEFVQAGAWLRRLGPPEWISVVPGNHDAYVPIERERSWAHWADYMTSDDPGPDHGVGFPFLRRRGPLAIVGLSSAVATAPGMATGRLGAAQLQALDRLLADLAAEGRCRVILTHHPPLGVARMWRKRLTDGAELRQVVARRGTEVILHGHEHAPRIRQLEGPHAPIPALGVPSASRLDARPERRAQYQIYRIEAAVEGWRLRSEVRVFDPALANFAPVSSDVSDQLMVGAGRLSAAVPQARP